MNSIVQFFGSDINQVSLSAQLQILSISFQNCVEKPSLSDAVGLHAVTLTSLSRIILRCLHLAQVKLVSPSSNAESERNASSLRRIKTYLRSTMSQQRLNNLMVLHVHKEK